MSPASLTARSPTEARDEERARTPVHVLASDICNSGAYNPGSTHVNLPTYIPNRSETMM